MPSNAWVGVAKRNQVNVPDPMAQEMAAQASAQNPFAQNPYMDVQQAKDLMEEYDNKYKELAATQQLGIDQLQKYANDYAQQNRDIDFRGLTGVLSSFDPKFQALNQTAQQLAPISREEQRAKVFGLQNEIQKQQQGMTNTQLEGLKDKLKMYSDERKAQQDMIKDALKNEYYDKKLELEAAKQKGQIDALEKRLRDSELNRQLREALADRANATKKEIAETMKGMRQDRTIETDAQKLQKTLGEMVPGVVTKLERLDKNLPGGIDQTGAGAGEDTPGVGVGMSLAPDWFLSPEGSAVQQDTRGLVADLIKIQSGTAASDKEVDRKLKEFGISPDSKESTYRRGVQNLKAEIQRAIESKEAAYRPEVVELYKSRGGVSSKDLVKEPSVEIQEWEGKRYMKQGNEWVEVK